MNRGARLIIGLAVVLAACGGSTSDDDVDVDPDVGGIAATLLPAVRAVEDERGGPQEYFEVTSTPQLVNVFVATDDGTAVVPYVFLNGGLQAAGPKQTGAVGQTFTADAIEFDPETVLEGIQTELPTATIDALSVEGGPAGFVRYVVSVRSAAGGAIDVIVAPDGAVLEVIPL